MSILSNKPDGTLRIHMDNRWNDIATAVYGLTNLRLIETRDHFSNHFFIESSQERFVLSCSPFQADRMVKSYQFQLMEVLKCNGFRHVSLPIQTLNGRYCYWGRKDWWVLNPYMPSDELPPWDSRDLITEAAQTLAALHSAGRKYRDELRAESEREDLGWYYVPSTRWAELSEKIAGAFHWNELSEDDALFLRSQLHFVQSNAAAIKSLCDEWGILSITHQDYRPANLRVWESKIATVWDFDMAVIDYSLYDVAFASLQFGGRECLFPEVSLDLAEHFVEAYIAATDKPKPFEEDGVLRWFLIVAVLRRLLLNYHIPERMELLRKIAGWDWLNRITPSL